MKDFLETLMKRRERFGSIGEASSFWRGLWKGEGTGNSQAVWLDEVRHAIFSKFPPPTDEAWTLETAEAVGVLKRKNWSAPGPDRLVNFWWKRAHALHEGVARSFEAISRTDHEYPSCFAEGKTSLIPKPGEFTSDNQRPIACLNTSYKWFTLCLLDPTDQHLKEHGLMEGSQRGAKKGCSGTVDDLLIDRVVTLGCKRRRRNLIMAYLFFLTTHQQWITPREGALVDDLELLSFEAFGFLLLISSGRIDFYQLSG